MLLLTALIGAGLLIFGLVEVWRGRWRAMWGAVGYLVVVASVCCTADVWPRWMKSSIGEGLVVIGNMWVSVIALAAAFSGLTLASLIYFWRKRRRAATQAL